VAACPVEALSLTGASETRYEATADRAVSFDQLVAFLAARRSVRRFKDEPVARELIDRVVEAAALAPMGFPPHSTHVLAIDRRDELDRLAAMLRDAYAKLLRMWANPLLRQVIRLKRGAETTHALRTHALHIVADDNAQHAKTGEDRYLYGAPVLLLFHASRWVAGYDENAFCVADYAMLAAHGLGATLLGIVPPVFNNFPGTKERYGIPEEHKVVTSLILGHPRYKFHRTIRRPLPPLRYL
jgi:nitroreductase